MMTNDRRLRWAALIDLTLWIQPALRAQTSVRSDKPGMLFYEPAPGNSAADNWCFKKGELRYVHTLNGNGSIGVGVSSDLMLFEPRGDAITGSLPWDDGLFGGDVFAWKGKQYMLYPAPGEEEFVELQNISTNSVPLYDAVRPTNSVTLPPADVYTFNTQNASVTVAATGAPPLHYQWRFNGSFLPAATNASLTVTNAQSTNAGTYNVVIFNSAGAVASSNALLALRVTGLITQQPTNRTVIAGNPYGSAPVSSNAVLTVLADHDRDGMADDWEVTYGFNTNTASDAFLDRDGDGMLNWQEYVAGTNPTNAQRYLKLDATSTCGQAVITFQAVSNRNYVISFTDGFEPSSWNTLTNVPARSTNWDVSIPDPTAATNRFYRVIIPANP
jgi:hypothetical protein